MNLILFEEEELTQELGCSDERTVHLERILNLHEGDSFSAGIIGGKIGEARLISRGASGWKWSFLPKFDSPSLHPLTLILGCPRPPVARRLLKDMTSLGLKEIRACSTDLNEKSYLTAKLWRDGLWRDALIEGAMQGAATHLPAIGTSDGLKRALENLPVGPECLRMALDNGPDSRNLSLEKGDWSEAILAVGPERGWSDGEREILKTAGFALTALGKRIMRTETACAVGAGLLLASLGVFHNG